MTQHNPNTIRILVIEDDDVVRITLSNALKKNGYHVLTAQNGNIGIEIYKREKPDIVITDMLMPDKEGLETILEIRALVPEARIIAMSGGGNSHNMSFLQFAEKLGASILLSKPIKPDQLIEAVNILMAQT